MKTVLLEDLRAGMVLAKDVYLTEDSYMPFIKKNTVLTDDTIKRFKSLGFMAVSIVSEPEPIPETLSAMFNVPKGKPAIGDALCTASLACLSDVFDALTINSEDIHESAKAVIGKLDDTVHCLVDALEDAESAIVNINDLKSFDDYTFHHSLSVAVLSIAIADYLRFSPQQIHKVGMCAMLHDIGKISVPIEIINKKGRLDDDEYTLIKMHSSSGFDSLYKSGHIDDDVLQGVLHHHEKYDGTGYPNGLSGDEIPIYSRIITIADVYDALTSNRPYRLPMQPGEACEYILGGAGKVFDFDLVNAFLHKIELYPVGSIVELSNGQLAAVLKNNHQLRPVVITADGETLDLENNPNCRCIVVQRLVAG